MNEEREEPIRITPDMLAEPGWQTRIDFERGMRAAPPLTLVGMACEHAFGLVWTAVVYCASSLTGSLLSVAMGPGPSVGASGAIFGVLAAVIVVL